MSEIDQVIEYLQDQIEAMKTLDDNPIAQQHQKAYESALDFIVNYIKREGEVIRDDIDEALDTTGKKVYYNGVLIKDGK